MDWLHTNYPVRDSGGCQVEVLPVDLITTSMHRESTSFLAAMLLENLNLHYVTVMIYQQYRYFCLCMLQHAVLQIVL